MANAQRKAFKIVEDRRLTASIKRDKLLEQLRQDKEFQELELKRDKIALETAYKAFKKEDITSNMKEYKASNKKVEDCLKRLGYTKEDLEIKYFCSKCKDTGMVNGVNCSCVKQLAYDIATQDCQIRETEADDIKDIDYSFYPIATRDNMKKRMLWLNEYANKFQECNYKTISLIGSVGTGKTFSASFLANKMIKEGYTVFICSAQRLNDIFLEYHLAQLKDKKRIFEPLIISDILIIDDLGTENIINKVTTNYLYTILTNRNNAPIVFTTNLRATDISKRYGERIASRMFDKRNSVNINFDGVDLRLK